MNFQIEDYPRLMIESKVVLIATSDPLLFGELYLLELSWATIRVRLMLDVPVLLSITHIKERKQNESKTEAK